MPRPLVPGTTIEVRQIAGGGWLAFRFSGRDESGAFLRSRVGADFEGEASGNGGMTRQGPVFCRGLRLSSSRLLGYWRRKVMRALSLSYGDISIFTRSPMTRRMKRLRILPEM